MANKTITTLQLGAVLSALIDTANNNFDIIATELKNLGEQGAKKAYVYETVDAMIESLRDNVDENGNDLKIDVGDEIYILETGSPDFWVTASNELGSGVDKPSEWDNDTDYQFGRYKVRVSGAGTIDLKGYLKTKDLAETINGLYPSTTTAPSEYAVWNLVKDFVQNSNLINTTATYTEEKNEALTVSIPEAIENHKNLINGHEDRIVTIEDKIKNGEIGGVVTAEELKAEYVKVTTDKLTNATGDDGVKRYYIVVEQTDTALGVFRKVDKEYNEIVVQKSMLEDPVSGEGKLYICIGTSPFDCYLCKLSGSAISSGGSGGSGMTDAQKHVMQFLLKGKTVTDCKETYSGNVIVNIDAMWNTRTLSAPIPYGFSEFENCRLKNLSLSNIEGTVSGVSVYPPTVTGEVKITDENAREFELTISVSPAQSTGTMVSYEAEVLYELEYV